MPSVKTNGAGGNRRSHHHGRAKRAQRAAMRLIVRIGLAVVADAIALLIAAAVLDGVRIDATSFAFAVGIFSLASRRSSGLRRWSTTSSRSASNDWRWAS